MRIVELGTECEIITKGTTPTTLGKTFTSSGIGFLRAQNVINSQVLIDSELLYIDNETHNNELKRSQIKEGDILLTIAGTIGRTAIVPAVDMELNCNQAVAIIRLGNSKINKEFLCHFIASPNAQDQFFKGMVTATIANLSLAQVRKLQIPLPPIETQQKIAAILDAADTLRQKDKALVAKYDELTQALFLDMLGDPVSNPKGWEKVELKSLCSFKKKSIKPEDIVQGENYVALDSIEKVTGKITTLYNVDKGELKSNKFWFDNSYILYGKLRPYLNKVALPYFEGVCSTDIIPIQPIYNKSNRTFITSILRHNSFVAFADERCSGANLPRISPTEVEKYSTINPPLNLQTQFAERVAIIEKQKAIAQASLEKSEELFKSLLQKAFKGELV